MKKYIFLSIVFAAILLQSCHKSADIQLQNNISKVRITDIKWGDHYLSSELLPGETSTKMSIAHSDESLPAKHKVSFTMTANQKYVYLETVEEFLLDEDDDLLITLTDSTQVRNPNQ